VRNEKQDVGASQFIEQPPTGASLIPLVQEERQLSVLPGLFHRPSAEGCQMERGGKKVTWVVLARHRRKRKEVVRDSRGKERPWAQEGFPHLCRGGWRRSMSERPEEKSGNSQECGGRCPTTAPPMPSSDA